MTFLYLVNFKHFSSFGSNCLPSLPQWNNYLSKTWAARNLPNSISQYYILKIDFIILFLATYNEPLPQDAFAFLRVTVRHEMCLEREAVCFCARNRWIYLSEGRFGKILVTEAAGRNKGQPVLISRVILPLCRARLVL